MIPGNGCVRLLVNVVAVALDRARPLDSPDMVRARMYAADKFASVHVFSSHEDERRAA